MAKEIVLIGAIGKRGQLGLNGGLPWGDDFPEDRHRFREVTTGGIVIVGKNTWLSVKHLDDTYGRKFRYDSTRNLNAIPDIVLDYVKNAVQTVFIAGGAKTYTRWLPYVTRFDITRLPYDGPADVWMPPLFPPQPQLQFSEERAWLQAEIAQLEDFLLNRTPEKDPVGHHQFTQRLADTRRRLETLKRIHDATAPLSPGQTDQSDASAGSL